ncbi:MAG: nucleoside phosphorylase [Saprospiraceae bacterium]|nr:nucleoside phosphorylase [Saprospiraceae bacterium]
MRQIPDSELVLNADGTIYHLCLFPEQIADIILTVGDPARVARISKYFDKIEYQVNHREFVTHTGWLGNTRLSVLSTGIGTDNMDIVLNELDALVNIDLKTRIPHSNHSILNIIRVGTSGAVWREAPVGSFITSAFGLGLDNLMHFYEYQNTSDEAKLIQDFAAFLKNPLPIQPYSFAANVELLNKMTLDLQGITLTAPGFYAPQGRELRANTKLTSETLTHLSNFQYKNWQITNFEMETSGLYGLAKVLGHRAVSCNVILANRLLGQFSLNPDKEVESLIENVLERIGSLTNFSQ